MTILLTGSCGFIAKYVIQENWKFGLDIVCLDKKMGEGIYHRIDLSTDIEELDKLFREENINYVIHLAGQTSVLQSQKYPTQDVKDNIIATLNLIEMCKKYSVEKIIYSSTASVYGEVETPNEKTPPQPSSNYGISKLACENYIKNSGIDYTILRFSNVYGIGGKGVISKLINSIIRGETFNLYGDGKQIRDYIYVKDIARNIISALLNPNLRNKTVNVSTGKGTDLNRIINIIETNTNGKIQIKSCEANKSEIRVSVLENNLLQELDRQSFTKVDLGIKQMLGELNANK